MQRLLKTDELKMDQQILLDILQRYGISCTAVSDSKLEELGSLHNLMEYLLSPCYVMRKKIELDSKMLGCMTEHCLAFRLDGTPVELIYTTLGYRLKDLLQGTSHWLKKKELETLQPEAYAVVRPLPENAHRVSTILKMTLKLLSIKDYLVIAACTLLVSALGLVIVDINNYVLQELVPEGVSPRMVLFLLTTAVIFISVRIVNSAASTLKAQINNRVNVKVMSYYESAMLARVLLVPKNAFAHTNAGEMSQKMRYTKDYINQLLNMVVGSSFTTIFSLIYIPELVRLGPHLWIPAMIFLTLQVSVSLLLARASIRNEAERIERGMDYSGFVYSTLKGIQKVQTAGAEDTMEAKWQSLYQRVLNTTLNPSTVLKLQGQLGSVVNGVGEIVLVAIAINTSMGKANYVVFNSAMGLASAAVLMFINSATRVLQAQPKYRQAKEILGVHLTSSQGKELLQHFDGNISIRDLSFAYDDGAVSVLEGVSLDIRAGEKVAFVGESGCGKSTLLSLIMGLEQPSSGSILYDGHDYRDLNMNFLRQSFSPVLQYGRLIPGTIYENLLYYNPDLTREDASALLDAACLQDLLASLGNGLDSRISENTGGGFSGGQRQRLLLARAFGKKAPVLVLDEATSALDNITQKKILEYVYSLDSTVIMIAHRLSTVMNCDRIFVMRQGEIAESGTYSELMAKNGLFHEFAVRQELSDLSVGE